MSRIKWIPLNHFSGWSCVIDDCNLRPAKVRSQLLDLFGNITLFVPLGLFFYLAIATKYPGRISTGHVVWAGLLFSTLIELSQIGLPTRTPDIDDIIFNSSGTWLGVRLAVILLTADPLTIVGRGHLAILRVVSRPPVKWAAVTSHHKVPID